MAAEAQGLSQGTEGNFKLGGERYPGGGSTGGMVGSQHGEEVPFNNWFRRRRRGLSFQWIP
jgi:hypothetical protein